MTDEQYTELNESIDRLSNNTQDTNNAVNDLREYLQDKDNKQAEAEAEAEQKAQEETEHQTEQQTAEQESTETEIQLLTEVKQELQLQNQMIAGSFMMSGIICGVLLFTILWNKFN